MLEPKAAATAAATSSTPVGYRPMSSRAVTGEELATTTPGSRWLAGHITHTPYTLAKRRSAACSLATPFCTHATGTDPGAEEPNWRSAVSVSWLFTARRTTSSSRQSTASGVCVTGTGSTTTPAAEASVRPVAAIALAWGPGDQEDVVAVLVEPTPDDAADRTRPEHYKSHATASHISKHLRRRASASSPRPEAEGVRLAPPLGPEAEGVRLASPPRPEAEGVRLASPPRPEDEGVRLAGRLRCTR